MYHQLNNSLKLELIYISGPNCQVSVCMACEQRCRYKVSRGVDVMNHNDEIVYICKHLFLHC